MSDAQGLAPLRVAPATEALARDVRQDLAGWAERWPIFDPIRFPAVALTTAVHLPELTRSARALAGLVSLWIIAFDEVVDQDRLSEEQIGELAADCRAIVAGRLVAPDGVAGPLCQSLGAIVHGVSACASFSAFAGDWRGSFDAMVAAIVEQRRLGRLWAAGASDRQAPPLYSYAAMLTLTAESIGVRFYLLTGFILAENPALAARRAPLLRCAVACARAIRLANDLRTWERDAREGNANTLLALEAELSAAEPSLPAEQRRERALQTLRPELDGAVAATRRLLGPGNPSGSAEAGVANLLTFVTGVYARADYDRDPSAPVDLTEDQP